MQVGFSRDLRIIGACQALCPLCSAKGQSLGTVPACWVGSSMCAGTRDVVPQDGILALHHPHHTLSTVVVVCLVSHVVQTGGCNLPRYVNSNQLESPIDHLLKVPSCRSYTILSPAKLLLLTLTGAQRPGPSQISHASFIHPRGLLRRC